MKKTFPNADIVGVGASVGGNFLLKYAGISKDKCLFKALVVISVPFDMEFTMETTSRMFPYFKYYDKFILKSLIHQAKSVSNYILAHPDDAKAKNIDIEQVMNSKSIYEFNQNLTLKMVDFKTVEEYYKKANIGSELDEVCIPVLVIHAVHDPVVPSTRIPYEKFKTNPYLSLALTQNGGHIAWFTGSITPKRWFPTPTLEFLEAALNH